MNRVKDLPLTLVDLFCGAGGSSLGFEMAGFEIVAGIDIDPDCCKTFSVNLRKAIEADLREYSGQDLRREVGTVDVVIGCPPCQGFTKMRNGASDPRNDLVPHFAELAAALSPAVIVFENVPGMFRYGKGYFEKFLKIIRQKGYIVTYGVLNAADYGVPQIRKRIVAVAVKRGLHVDPVLPEPDHSRPRSSKARLKPWKTVRDAIGDLPPLSPGEKSSFHPLHFAPRHSPKVMEIIRNVPKNGGSRKDLPKRLWLECHRKTKGFNDVYGRMSWDRPSPTITSGCCNPSKGRFIHPEQDRAITPLEAARLQSFPDDFRFQWRSTGSLTFQIGNALPPLLAFKIAKKTIEILSLSI